MLVQLQLVLSALILCTAFMILIQRRAVSMTYTFAWQSLFLSLATLLEAIIRNRVDLYFSALLTCVLKVVIIPWFLIYLANNLVVGGAKQEPSRLIRSPFLISMVAAFLVMFAYHLVLPLREITQFISSNVISVALSLVLLGMFIIITHRKAISHAIGFMVMENGIFFAALVSTGGMPMAVELGIALDVLVAIILFGVFFLHLRNSIDSFDVDRLNRLREDQNDDTE